MEYVLELIIVVVIQIILETVVNIQFVMEYHPIILYHVMELEIVPYLTTAIVI